MQVGYGWAVSMRVRLGPTLTKVNSVGAISIFTGPKAISKGTVGGSISIKIGLLIEPFSLENLERDMLNIRIK